MGLVAGVLTLNGILLVVGLCLLSAHLRGQGALVALSYAGVALLVGAGATGVVLHGVVVAGARSGPLTLGLVAAALACLGLLGTRFRSRVTRTAAEAGEPVPGAPDWRGLVQVGSAAILFALLALTVVAGFRSAPFLDDTWGFWLPRGLPLDHLGLDARLFASDPIYATLDHPDYPLWWSLLAGLDMRFIGELDLRATTGQTALLVAAFFPAAARLLWGVVRPWILWPGLLLLAASPELLRQTQSGGADLALAVYLALFVVAAGLWLWRGERVTLAVAFVCAATALLVKGEGLPQLVIVAAALGAFGLSHARRRVGWLWLTVAGAAVAASPWFLWRRAHHIVSLSDVRLGNALSPGYLADHSDRVGPAANRFAFHLTNPREWLIVVPLALVASVFVAWRARRLVWLAPAAVVVAVYAFWVWVNWADSLELQDRLGTSSYRVIDALILIAGVSIPVLAERALRRAPTVPRQTTPGV